MGVALCFTFLRDSAGHCRRFTRTPRFIAEPLHALRARYGLAPDPDLKMLQRGLVLSSFPPRFRAPDFPLPATAVSLRPFGIDPNSGGSLPAWVAELPDQPNVCFNLGTEFNT